MRFGAPRYRHLHHKPHHPELFKKRMVLLSLFISIADSSLLTALVVAVSVLVDVIMFLVKIPAVETYVDKTTLPAIAFGAVPDLFFGYSSPDSLATYFDRLGDDGRVAYKALSRWDYFP